MFIDRHVMLKLNVAGKCLKQIMSIILAPSCCYFKNAFLG